MPDVPDIDGRRKREIRQHVERIAPHYTPTWDPAEGGVGSGMVHIFAELAEEVTERLDAAPEKHRVAFFDALGFDARPPQPAQVPVQLRLEENAPRNVIVRPGTEAVAETDEEVTFRVGEESAFEATPARMTNVVAVNPGADAVFDHTDVIDGGDVTLFDGEDVQEHVCYLGDADLLTVGEKTTITIVLETEADPDTVRDELLWEYYGEAPDKGDDAVEDWHVVDDPVLNPKSSDGTVAVGISPGGPLIETAVDGIKSKWLRFQLPANRVPDGELSFWVDSVGLGLVPEPLHPDRLLANDVPQPAEPEDESTSIAPFGETPRQLDVFYLASEDVFTKTGSEVIVTFHGDGGEFPSAGDPDNEFRQRHFHEEVMREHGLLEPTDLDAEHTDFATDVDDSGIVTEGKQTKAATKSDENSLVSSTEADGGEVRKPGDTGASNHPTLSWEYWDGSSWARIPELSDETRSFTTGGNVTFVVPGDLAATSVSGHEAHWIRARLVGGDYGEVVYVEEDEKRWARTVEVGSPPRYDAVTVRYAFSATQRPNHVITHNALSHEHVDLETDCPFRPFLRLSEASQTIYLRFDRALSGGPIQLFVNVADQTFPAWFAPRVRWERATDPDGDQWARIPTSDGTESLTERGIVGLSFEEPSIALERFGADGHWIRARVRGTPFETGRDDGVESNEDGRRLSGIGQRVAAAGGVSSARAEAGECDGRCRSTRQPCGATVETAPPAGKLTTNSPSVDGIYLNTGWTRNVEAVDNEVLGGSDGERDQQFSVDDPPVLEPTVWVDELNTLSGPQMSALEITRPEDVIREQGSGGDARAFWVRWERVDAFVDSDGTNRHYVLEQIDGRIRFGNGTRGMIPPRGTNNVRVSYVTGGGRVGNVPAGAVDELKSGIPFVETVTNPVPGIGGALAEATDTVIERAPRELRDRNRAVAPADFERLAVESSRLIARARCLSGMDAAGEFTPGWVTVLVVPDDDSIRPAPSTGLLAQVEASLSAHAHVGLVARNRLVVRGPSYVAVEVDADIVAGAVETLGTFEERVEEALSEFLHPLSGGHENDGWGFGELPSRSDVYALLEGIDGVDHVETLDIVFTGEQTVTSTESEASPTTSPDALVYGSTHDLTLRRSAELGGES